MDPNIARTEDTSATPAPPHDFNIAQAFPVTDELVRKIRKNQRREVLHRIINGPSLGYAVVLIAGFALVGLMSRR